MFPATLKGVDQFLKSITCNRCLLPNDNLHFVGTSCKHVFCWSCINEICYGIFPQCPLCAMPISSSEIMPAYFLNQLFQLGLKLQENIRELEGSNVEAHKLENLFEPDMEKRTAEEFCATQTDVNTFDKTTVKCEGGENEDLNAIDASSIWRQSTEDVPGTSMEIPPILQRQRVESPKASGRGTKREGDSPSIYDIGEFQLQAPIHDTFLFSQISTQTMPLPQMTQQLPVFEEPQTLCFFQQRPKKTFADRIVPKPKKSGTRKCESKLPKLRSGSPEVF